MPAVEQKIIINVTDNATQKIQEIATAVSDIEQKLSKMSASASTAFANLTGLGIGGGAFKTFVDEVKNWSMSVNNDIMDKTGLTDEAASRLLVVAQSVGLSGEEMGNALLKMSSSAASAREAILQANASGQESSDVFSKWGITILDTSGQLLSAEQIMRNVIERHRDMSSSIAQNAMEMEIFGRSGGKLNDLLNLSTERMDEFIDNAERMGLILGTGTSQAWEDFLQNNTKLEMSLKGLAVQVGNHMLPTLISLSDSTTETLNAIGQMDDGTKDMIITVGGVVTGIATLSMTIQSAQLVFGPFIDLVSSTVSWLGKLEIAAYGARIATAGVLAVVAAVAYKAYSDYEHYQNGGEFEYDELGNVRRKEIEPDAAPDSQASPATRMGKVKPVIPPPNPYDNGSRFIPSVSTKSSKENNKYDQMFERYKKLLADMNMKIAMEEMDAYGKAVARTDAEIDRLGEDIQKIQKEGIDTSDLEARIGKYKELMQLKAEDARRDETIRNMEVEMSRTSLRTDLENRTNAEINIIRGKQLADYKQFLQEQLENTRLQINERLELERKLANTIKEQNNNAAYNYKDGWRLALDDLRNYNVNFHDEFGDMFNSMGGTIAGTFDDIAISGDTLGQRLANVWMNIENTIINTLLRVTMQMLVVKPLMNALSGILGGGGKGGGNVPSLFETGAISKIPYYQTQQRASGGYTYPGMVLVGEHGPELLETKNPGRVYTNQELANAIGTGGNQQPQTNIVFNISTPNAESFKQSQAQIFASANYALTGGRRGL